MFALDLAAFKDKTDARLDLVVRKIVTDVATKLILKSPVGDATYWKHDAPPGYVGGRFRANWLYGAGSPDERTLVREPDPTGANAISAIVGNLNEVNNPRIVHYITNSLPYAMRLEEGWSYRQAPQGMVGLTVLEFEPVVKEAAEALL
jgi:hypothetical protein